MLEILHAQPPLTVVYLPAISPYVYLTAVVRMEPVNLRWKHPCFPDTMLLFMLFFSFLKCHPSMSLSHSFNLQQKFSHLFVNCFVSPYSFLENRPVFFPLNPLNSLHLFNVKNSISPVIVIVVFVFFLIILISLKKLPYLFLCLTVVTYILPI